VNFASNTLVIITSHGDPKQIESFADLAKPGLKVVVCKQPVPCGTATKRIEDKTGVRLNPVSEELAVSDVVTKVTSGEADAGLVYVTDALNADDTVTTVKFPESVDAVNVYLIAALKHAPQPAPAQKFVDLVTGETGQRILRQALTVSRDQIYRCAALGLHPRRRGDDLCGTSPGGRRGQG
jgi:molybdate transport system substrate-binding protein